ncbi:MAG: hypothetical protein ACFB0F_16325 [Neomegalonema sp.]
MSDRLTLVFARKADDLELSAERLSTALGIRFVRRDSDYWGGDYHLARNIDGIAAECRLHVNADFYDGAPIFSEQPDATLMLHFHESENEARIVAAATEAGFELRARKTSL